MVLPTALCTKWKITSAVDFLANVNSSSCSLYVVVRPSVTFVRPTQTTEIFGNVSSCRVPWSSIDIQVKFYEDRPRGTPPSGELNRRGAVSYTHLTLPTNREV